MLVYFRETALAYQPDMVVIAMQPLDAVFGAEQPAVCPKLHAAGLAEELPPPLCDLHYVVEVKLKSFYERHRAKFIR